MTEKQLNNLYYIKKRIKKLKYRIAELERELGIGGQNLTGMPHGSSVSNPIEALIIKKSALEGDLQKELANALDEERKIRNFMSSVDDEEIKIIIELRFINFMKWADIGAELDNDRTTPHKKLKKFLENY